jgi:predicted transcriptional regulator
LAYFLENMAAKKFGNDNYIVIKGWMVNILHLSGTDLLIYALIHGFSQDRESEYNGGTAYLMSATGTSKPTVIKALKSLADKNLIEKTEREMCGVKFCAYKAIIPNEVANLYNAETAQNLTTGKETLPPVKNEQERGKETCIGGKETLPNNKYIYNNNQEKPITINSDSQKEESFCPPFSKETVVIAQERKTLFCNSEVAKRFDKDGVIDVQAMQAYFSEESKLGADLAYYYHVVSDWSDTRNMKRTARGWMATIRNFIRDDARKGHLVTVSQQERKRQVDALFNEVKARCFGETADQETDAIWNAVSVGDSKK